MDVLQRPRCPDRIDARVGPLSVPGSGGVDEKGRNGGVGYSVNVPLEPFTDDESWISCFEGVVPAALRAFAPDLILSQNGCDGHALDPLLTSVQRPASTSMCPIGYTTWPTNSAEAAG